MNDVRVRCTTVKQACDTVLHAKGFAWAMRKLLAMGNYINGGGSKGQAWGFKMDTLASTLGTPYATPLLAGCLLLLAGCCRVLLRVAAAMLQGRGRLWWAVSHWRR